MSRTSLLASLLGFVSVLQFGYPITGYGELWTALYMVLYAVMLIFGLLVVHAEGETYRPLIAVTVVFLFTGTWFSLDQDSTPAAVAMLVSVALSMASLMFSLMRFVFRRGTVPGIDLVLAAITAYLILGGLAAASFTLLEIAVPGSFEDPQADGPLVWQQLLYYSYVTVATLGYGDVLPITPWARSLGSLLSVAGTLYLTVIVARLVGIWSSSRDDAARG
ncbi:potassium channel family protein [Nocardiopsis sp. EMB25]|uniref:potassium channel family protein n=1 Tax=Nocardiopsis TaxID=2013 RepID=UPI000344F027|nr:MULTISPECIES: potassium channel family protein [Nocardiopsis]MCY9786349.1 potassium channel family protein [Nocardiopsis sp. EMB25]